MSQQFAAYPSLRGKTVLITGGAEGIGAACVESFWQQGSKVVFLDISESSAQKLLDKLRTSHPDLASSTPLPTFMQCDVTDLARLRTCAEEVVKNPSFGGAVDILLNNAASAGARTRVGTEQVTPESWDADVNVNLRHQFFLTQAVLPGMKAKGKGSIINLSLIHI